MKIPTFQSFSQARVLLLVALYFLCFLQIASAQPPDGIRYQGVVRNLDNQVLTNQDISIQITILQNNENGPNIYQETHVATTNNAGVFSIKIGTGNTNSNNFSDIDWEDGPYFIRQEIDPDGGVNYSISGTTEILSVPYALYADKSGKAASATKANFADSLSIEARNELAMPVGSVLPFAGAVVPSGWLLCDSSAYDINVYQELYQVIGYTYGQVNDRFRVPGLIGRGLVGAGLSGSSDTSRVEVALGGTGGKVQHTLQELELPVHDHGIDSVTHSHLVVTNRTFSGNSGGGWEPNRSLALGRSTSGNATYFLSSAGDERVPDRGKTSPDTHDHGGATAPTGGGMAHPTLDPYLGINFIIKAR